MPGRSVLMRTTCAAAHKPDGVNADGFGLERAKRDEASGSVVMRSQRAHRSTDQYTGSEWFQVVAYRLLGHLLAHAPSDFCRAAVVNPTPDPRIQHFTHIGIE